MNDANQDNPYRSPETITGKEPRRSAVLTRDQLYAIASWHKRLRSALVCWANLCVVGLVLLILDYMAAGATSTWSSWVLFALIPLTGCVIAMWILGIASAFVLIGKFSNALIALAAIILITPVLGPFLYLAVDLHTSRLLKRHGIHVGWWGANVSDVR